MIRRVISAVLAAVLLLAVLPIGRKVHAASGPYAGAVTVSSGSLNVRQQPSTVSTVTASLKKGSHITLISKSGSWWYVQYGKDSYGYCHSNYITPIAGTADKVSDNVSYLTVRSGPGTSYARLSYLEGGEGIVVLSTANGWSRILYHGVKTGYVSSRYLSGKAETGVALNVPSFKQTDSRWANVKIGASGKTMAQIGCATTAIAMMESYRTGSTVYPDAMAKKLKYTSSGSVYWPGHYIARTDKADLAQIRQLLQAGKPVLFGAKNRYGSQHWVVITGFSGGELTASNFSIHDPGSHARVNLQQFLNVYPVFYKYFHY